ncbi:MAG: 2-amino-4-hydroxy-6-hydroxymethyldihydropteridine diphosphokinase [Oligoflexia bacterium]|nr:2-amino-4-hydroxy-6-hydroxymethyldihydropteridine diphosphokinase [Oligoflexia bacterium]
MQEAIVSLGSNFGDRKEMLKKAVERISFGCKITGISNVYETFPKTGAHLKPYLNCCVSIETDMDPKGLMLFLVEIERQLVAESTGASETHHPIDCDLIAVGQEVVMTPQLTLPHPDAHRRAFVMIPLADFKADWVHPILEKNAETLAQEAFWDGWGRYHSPGQSLLDF